MEGWRKQGGVDVGGGEVVSGHGIPERNLKCFHRADQEQDKSRIVNVNKDKQISFDKRVRTNKSHQLITFPTSCNNL